MGERSTMGEFYWFFGVIEDRRDFDLQLGRVRVRILNAHSAYTNDIKREELPWAQIIMPVTSASVSGIGMSPTGIVDGAYVFGFFRDGHLCQLPVILGTWHGIVEDLKPQDIGSDVKQNDNPNFGKVIQTNAGDGFKDQRTEEELKLYPKTVKTLKFPDGKKVEGNDHGVQLEDEYQKKNPLDQFKEKTDVSAVAINDEEGLKKTIYNYKKLRRPDGLIDNGFIHMDMVQDTFKCGITNESKISVVPNPIDSTAKTSLSIEWKPYSESPQALDDGGNIIYNKKNRVKI